jgi:hypothetical protein
VKAAGFDQNNNTTAAFHPDSWTNLCWQPLSVEVNSNSQVTVIWKGRTLLNNVQTTYFPSAGALVLGGRTGGADEHTHFDNIRLTTSASAADTTPPTTPGNLVAATPQGAGRVALTWDPSTDNSGRVGYEVQRGDGTVTNVVATGLVPTTFIDYPPKPETQYTSWFLLMMSLQLLTCRHRASNHHCRRGDCRHGEGGNLHRH